MATTNGQPRAVPLIPVVLDHERHLLLDVWALYTAEQELRKSQGIGFNLLSMFQGGGLGMTELLTLVWAGLRHEDPSLTLEATGHLIHPGNMGTVQEALGQALREQTTSHEPSAEGAGDDPLPSTGESLKPAPLSSSV
jgi:hypothetical protein